MVARGRVQDGVVVLDNGVRLPEGQEVTVLADRAGASPAEGLTAHGILHILPVSLGPVLRSITADDLLGEMLEGRSERGREIEREPALERI